MKKNIYIRQPVRKLIHRGSPRVTGRFASLKMKRSIPWESLLERDQIHILEFLRDVKAYHPQPFRTQYRLDDVVHTYVPDFEVECTDRIDEIHEVKPDEEADNADNIRKFDVLSHYYEQEKQSLFKVIKESEIRQKHRLDNIENLFRFLHHRPSDRDVLKILNTFDRREEFQLRELLTHFTKATLFSLLSRGELEMEISQPLTPLSNVWLGSNRSIC